MKHNICLGLALMLIFACSAQAQVERSSMRRFTPVRPVSEYAQRNAIMARNNEVPRFSLDRVPDYSSQVYRDRYRPDFLRDNISAGNSGGNGGAGYTGFSWGADDSSSGKSSAPITKYFSDAELSRMNRLVIPTFAENYQCSCCGQMVNRGIGHVCPQATTCCLHK